MYRFFSTKYMTKGHIDAIRRSRRILVTDKVLNYDSGMFLEHINYGQPLFVKPKDDPILKELEGLQLGEFGEYDYSSLSKEFKRYMRFKDDELFNKAYHDWKNSDRFADLKKDRIIDQLEDKYDRDLFESELFDVLSGKRVKNVKPVWVKARASNRRAYKTVLELIRANLNTFESFITLTFARKEQEQKYLDNGMNFKLVEDVKDFIEVKKCFSKFINTISKNMRRKEKEFEYVAVYEQHKDGSYHFHMISTKIDQEYLIDAPEWLDVDYKTKKRRNGKMIEKWVYGKSDVEEIRDKEKMSTYLVKYLVKNFNSLNDNDDTYNEYLGKKKYFVSRGLKRPEVEYLPLNDFDQIEILEKRKAEYSDKYSTTYNNYYSKSEIQKTICSYQQL